MIFYNKKYTCLALAFTLLLFFQSQAQLILSTDASWSVLRSQTEPAGNWKILLFDDSAWFSATSVSIPSCLAPHQQSPASNCGVVSTPIWAQNPGNQCTIVPGGSNGSDVVYFRKKFYVPAANEACGYYLYVKADDNTEIYINGQLLGTTQNNWTSGTYFNIPATMLKYNNQKNIIAVKATDYGTTAWFSAVLCRVCT